MSATVTDRVAAGAAFLDEHDPGWWRADAERAVDLEDLDLGSTRFCILGQRCPLEILAAARKAAGDDEWGIERYDAYAIALFGASAPDDPHVAAHATALGFAWVGCPEGGMDALTAEWKRVIETRREKP